MESLIEYRKVLSLAKRDMHKWATYRTAAITGIISTIVGFASWGFVAGFRNVTVAQYNTDYVSFLLSGILISTLILPLGNVNRIVNPWTLETILMTGIRTPTFVIGTVGWSYLLSVILFIPQLLIGIFFFHAHFSVNFVSLPLAIVISGVIVFCLAMMSAAMRIVTKGADPVTWGINLAASIFSGMTFPIASLNNYIPGLSNVSWYLPQTWIYQIIRLSSLDDGSLLDPNVATSFLVALLFAIALIPLAIYVYRWGMTRAKRDGTLGMF